MGSEEDKALPISEQGKGKKKKTGPEKLFQARLQRFMKKYGIYNFKYFATRYAKRGVPDIIACTSPDGKFWGIETKSEHGHPRPEQKEAINQITDLGGIGCIVWPEEEYLLKAALIGHKEAREILKGKTGRDRKEATKWTPQRLKSIITSLL